MKKRLLIAVVAMVLLFSACDKDKKDETVKTYDPMKTTVKSNQNAWWEQYTTEASATQANNNSQTSSNSGSNSGSNKTTGKANGGSSSGKTTKSSNTTAPKQDSASQDLGYTKVNNYTMTFENTNGGTTTLTRDPSNQYISKTLSMLSSNLGETARADQLMCITDTTQSFSIIYVFSGSSGKNTSTLVYVLCLKPNLTPAVSIQTSSGDVYPFFPYASSGGTNYNTYRQKYKELMDSQDTSLYQTVREQYSAPFNDSNVKTFLSW